MMANWNLVWLDSIWVLILEAGFELTFPEFHFETEAEVDFPSTYI